MFAESCCLLHECIYGITGLSQVGPNQVNATNGTGFMIAAGVLATAAHLCHVDNDSSKPVHPTFEAIRSPDIGQRMEKASLIAEDSTRDLALLRIENARSAASVRLACDVVRTGTTSGSLGFPLASVMFVPEGRMFNLVERFQSSSVSAYRTQVDPSGRALAFYETDALMYGGSSGCPGFLKDGTVFGMHVASIIDQTVAQANAGQSGGTNANRLAISIWVPSADIRDFAAANGVSLDACVA